MTTIFMPGMTIGSGLGTDLGISRRSTSLPIASRFDNPSYQGSVATAAATVHIPAVATGADAARKWGRPPRGEPR